MTPEQMNKRPRIALPVRPGRYTGTCTSQDLMSELPPGPHIQPYLDEITLGVGRFTTTGRVMDDAASFLANVIQFTLAKYNVDPPADPLSRVVGKALSARIARMTNEGMADILAKSLMGGLCQGWSSAIARAADSLHATISFETSTENLALPRNVLAQFKLTGWSYFMPVPPKPWLKV